MKKVNFMKTILPRAGAGAGSNQKRAAPGGSATLPVAICAVSLLALLPTIRRFGSHHRNCNKKI